MRHASASRTAVWLVRMHPSNQRPVLLLSVSIMSVYQNLWMNWPGQGFWIYLLHCRIRHSFAHLRPVILSADWSIRRLQSWTCSSLPTVAEFLKLTQSIVTATVRRLVQSPTLQLTIFCGCPSDLRGKGLPLGSRLAPPTLQTFWHERTTR